MHCSVCARRYVMVLCVCMAVTASFAWAQGVIYVDADAAGANDGTSWPDAFTELQSALAVAVAGQEVWVAEGTYRPDRDAAHPNGSGDRAASFRLAQGVYLYGGFAGTEANREERDPSTNVTILSGDLNDNDGPNFANTGDNSYHVVRNSGYFFTGLDGFTVSGGNANGSSNWDAYGGGILLLYAPSRPVVVSNCTLTGNSAALGGAMFTEGSPDVSNCMFSVNRSTGNGLLAGAGLFASGGGGGAVLTNCMFVGNYSTGVTGGGGVCTTFALTLIDCVFSGNSCGWHGGGMLAYSGSVVLIRCAFIENSASAGGGLSCLSGSSPTLTNCMFSGNSAWAGGGMYSAGSSTLAQCTFSGNSAAAGGGGMNNGLGHTSTLTNCTFSGNSAPGGGGICNNSGVTSILADCILWGNTASTDSQISGSATVTYSCVQGGWAGEGNISTDPRLLSDLRLRHGSPCIDAGDNAAVPIAVTTDLAGNLRFVDDPDTADTGSGTAPIVDMGAYEYPAISGDFDFDGDVDLADFGLFAACFNGPNRAPADGCVVGADLDTDDDVDLADFGVYAACFNGPNRPPAAGCW